jgi:hypothetical protein
MLYSRIMLILFSVLLIVAAAIPVAAENPPKTLQTLLDRAQIEDTLVDYYGQLGNEGRDYSDFYAQDGVLDVNGMIAKGKKEIEDLYKKSAEGSSLPPGAFRMLLTNMKIAVNGATATADVIWTGISSETVKSTPKLVEQGREHDEFVKLNGKWLFKHRVITSDGGLPPFFEKNYKKR